MLSQLRALRVTRRRLNRLILILFAVQLATAAVAAWRFPHWSAWVLLSLAVFVAVVLGTVVVERRHNGRAIARLRRGEHKRNERYSR